MNAVLVNERFSKFMDRIRDDLHPRAREIVEGFVDVGETKLAAEHLCELMSEDGVVLSMPDHQELIELISALGLSEYFRNIVLVPNA